MTDLLQRQQMINVRRRKMQHDRALREAAAKASSGGVLATLSSPSAAAVLPRRRGSAITVQDLVGTPPGERRSTGEDGDAPTCGRCGGGLVLEPEEECWCDACASAGVKTQGTEYRCSAACDYDLCAACFAGIPACKSGQSGCETAAAPSNSVSHDCATDARGGVSALVDLLDPLPELQFESHHPVATSREKPLHRGRQQQRVDRCCTTAGPRAINMLKQSRSDGSINRARRVQSAMETRNAARLEQQARLSRMLPLLKSSVLV